ncbi:hypothetical protein NU195Hw_g6220t1 [Hortaea werneckii]
MATTTDPAPNGAVSPAVPEPLSPPDNKRKRENDVESQPAVAQGPNVSVRSKQTQRDVLEILQQYDTSPSFLEHPLAGESSAGGPSQKKARLSDGTHDETTISSKLDNGAYASLDGLKEDATGVCESLETSLRAKAKEAGAPNAGRLSVEELKRIQRAKAFARLIEDVLDKEREYSSVNDEQVDQKNTGIKVNGHSGDAMAGPDQKLGTVLTLFGNAPTPKQLFSSLQHAPAGRGESAIKSELPVEEMSLPNGLTATKIMPPPRDDSKKGPSFEEAFPPPYNLPSLHPPKAHKRSSTRDMTLKWEFKDAVNRSSKKGGYTVQGLTTGDWLGYGGVDPVQTASPKEKRKQRERALSSGDRVKEPPSQATREEQRAKEEEALFRRAYGSFAPSVDNAKSVVPAHTKSAVWWEKVGERRFHETFAIDPALVEGPSAEEADMRSILPEHSDIPENFESVIEELDKMDEDPVQVEAVASKTDVEMVLREVAELLETLASHQRIRNASLPSSHQASSRNPLSPAPVLASRIGKPDEPAEAEVSTYHALRRELAYLILKLPPYAVAKIDGDQLAELGVNKLIPFETKDYKGTMEEDQVARLAKYNAMATAAGIATLTRGNSASGQHYNTTGPQRTPAIGQAANTRYGQTGQYGAARTPATQPQFQRSTSNQSYSTPTATAPRPTYAQQPSQYPRPGVPQQTYGQPNGQPQYYQQRPPTQTPGGYGGGYNQQYSQTPQTQPRPAYSSSQPLAQFQARSHAAAANAVAYQANSGTPGPYNRTASPATAPPKPSYAQAPQQPGSIQPRPPVYQQAPPPQPGQYAQAPGSGRATPSFPPSQPGTPVNGYQARPPQPPPMQPGVARAASGTPQPAAQGQGQGFVQPQPQPQQQQQMQANGHQ